MTNEELIELRSEYQKLKQERDNVREIEKRIDKLEKTPEVKEYLHLLDALEYKNIGINFNTMSDSELLDKTLRNVKTTNTSHIYVYLGSYKVEEIDEDKDYKRYRSLELYDYQDGFEVNIPISKCKEFEKRNHIIYLKTSLPGMKYYSVRKEYFEAAIENDCEYATNYILKKYKKEN